MKLIIKVCLSPFSVKCSLQSFIFSNILLVFIWILGIPLQEISGSPSAFTGRSFRNWLTELRNSHSLIKSSRSALIDRLLEGYDCARHGTGVGRRPLTLTDRVKVDLLLLISCGSCVSDVRGGRVS